MSLFFHADMDAFYASIEELRHPEWQGLPLIIGAMPYQRGVICTCNYEARKFDVHAAMPSSTAYKKCPRAIFITPDFENYHQISRQIAAIFQSLSEKPIITLGLDEAWIDLSENEQALKDPVAFAHKIQTLIGQELGLTLSIGIAKNKFLAKLCSKINKPNGVFYLENDAILSFLETLPLKDLWGIGKKSIAFLKANGITTVKELQQQSLASLEQFATKKFAQTLYAHCRGEEANNFLASTKSHSISRETTFLEDEANLNTILNELHFLAIAVFDRLLEKKLFGKTLFIKMRFNNFETVQAQRKLPYTIANSLDLYYLAKQLFLGKYEQPRALRLVGVGLTDFVSSGENLLFATHNEEKFRKLDELSLSFKTKGILVTKASLLPTAQKYQLRKAAGQQIFDGRTKPITF